MLNCCSSLACFLIGGWLVGNGIIAGSYILCVHVYMSACAYVCVHATLDKGVFKIDFYLKQLLQETPCTHVHVSTCAHVCYAV